MSLEYPIDVYGLKRQVFNFTVAKTFLTLTQLSQLKTYDEGYQRKRDEEHENGIKTFLENNGNRYLPDIILVVRHPRINLNAPKELISGDMYIRNIEAYGILRLQFSKDEALNYIKVVDGNHRIAAIKKLLDEKPDSDLGDFETGVTFILTNDTQEDFEREMALFYNLNAKSKPLLPLDFLSESLENRLSLEKAKEIDWWLYVFKKSYDSLKDILTETLADKDIKEIVANACHYFAHNIPAQDHEKLPTVLDAIRTILDEEKLDRTLLKLFIEKDSLDQLLSIIFFVYQKIGDIDKCIWEVQSFSQWMLREAKLNNFENFENLYQTYKETYIPKDFKIFVAMEFRDQDDVFSAIKGTIDSVKRDMELPLECIRIDQLNTGTTYQIMDEILNQIQHNRLMIADLTNMNANVYLEVGFAMGLCKERGISNQIILLVKEDEKGAKVGFDLQSYKQNRYKNTEELRTKLEAELKVYYKNYSL